MFYKIVSIIILLLPFAVAQTAPPHVSLPLWVPDADRPSGGTVIVPEITFLSVDTQHNTASLNVIKSVTVITAPAGSQASGSFVDGVLTLTIPAPAVPQRKYQQILAYDNARGGWFLPKPKAANIVLRVNGQEMYDGYDFVTRPEDAGITFKSINYSTGPILGPSIPAANTRVSVDYDDVQ